MLPPFVTPVGLFVNAAPPTIGAARRRRADAACCSSTATRRPASATRTRRPYLRAARMAPELDLLDFARRFGKAQGLLLDAHVEGFGGGGKVFDWSLVPAGVPGHRLVLSGGLHAGNVDRRHPAAAALGR